MANVTLIGIDLAKTIFQVCGVNRAGKQIFNRTLRRNKLLEFLKDYPQCTIAMEACSGSNYWGRTLEAMAYKVMLIPPQHVKPFVKGNKNDRNDAFAICEAARRPHLQTVKPRTLEQTDMMMLHRRRERLVNTRNRLLNQVRGFLREYGIVVPAGLAALRRQLRLIPEDADNGLTVAAREWLQESIEEWDQLHARIDGCERKIKQAVKQSPAASRLMAIKGVAEITASVAVAFAGDGAAYKNGRHFSANLGLVPRESSSGGKQRLGAITKRGNQYLRHCLIQGAWSVLRHAGHNEDRLSRWAAQLAARRGQKIAVVAVANKLARIIWAMLYHQTEYRAI